MRISFRAEHFLLFLGDLVVLGLSLWLTLLLRYGPQPSQSILDAHIQAFGLLFVIWIVIFFIAGLYEKQTVVVRGSLPSVLLRTQVVNSVVAVLFFYFIPHFGIAPKTNLFIYLVISLLLLLAWRLYGFSLLEVKRRVDAVLVASGNEAKELFQEVNANNRYRVSFVEHLDPSSLSNEALEAAMVRLVRQQGVQTVVIDLADQKIRNVSSHLYSLIFSGINFVDISLLYEQIFDRVPLSLLTYEWFLKYASGRGNAGYDLLKRAMDIVLSLILGVVSLIFYPFVWMAVKLDDGGPVFISQDRIGQGGRPIKIHKFRTMTTDDAGDEGQRKENKITRIGGFLRKTRIDELPQLWNVLVGDMSMIGPRPELPVYVALYDKEVPYYSVRHIIKPGLSGWAQLYHKNPPKGDADAGETRNKLSYDLFYIKRRSLFLDVSIALKTIKTFISRSGR